jgi:hypothetical protein
MADVEARASGVSVCNPNDPSLDIHDEYRLRRATA